MATNKTRRLYAHAWLAPLLALAMLFWVGAPASGQTSPTAMPTQDNDTTRGEVASMDAFLDRHPEISEQLRKDPSLINNATWVDQHPALQEFLKNHAGVREEFTEDPNGFMRQEARFDRQTDNRNDRDTTRRELANMDQFLDNHREIAEQLRKDPSLIKNTSWVGQHPALQEFLQSHPGIREEFSENPNRFMRQEIRYDRRDTTSTELVNMDRFLDSHREISEQLRKDPSLINNTTWVGQHPALQEFLQSHPGVRREFREDPNAFMRQEERFDRREGDRDTTRWELASMDRFLDSHQEISEQLRKDPSLIDNRQWVENHPALQQYLQSHPQVREEFRENPNVFMQAEMRFDQREDRRNDRGEMAGFSQFLGGHSTIAEQLSKDPSLANNKEFLANHPELGEYLKAHPGVTQQLATNPQAVMSSSSVTQTSGATTTTKTSTPKVKIDPNR